MFMLSPSFLIQTSCFSGEASINVKQMQPPSLRSEILSLTDDWDLNYNIYMSKLNKKMIEKVMESALKSSKIEGAIVSKKSI